MLLLCDIFVALYKVRSQVRPNHLKFLCCNPQTSLPTPYVNSIKLSRLSKIDSNKIITKYVLQFSQIPVYFQDKCDKISGLSDPVPSFLMNVSQKVFLSKSLS